MDITGTKDFSAAQVTAGGVPLTELDPHTMASKKAPGLYLAGEMLNIHGDRGGYNLHFAWASGISGRKKRSLSLSEGGKTMIRISDISMPLHYTDEALRRAAAKKLHTDAQKLKKLALVKRSVDARKKQDVRFVVTVDVETDGNEDKLLSRARDSHVTKAPKRTYAIPPHGTLSQRPVVVGFGPAGMFAGLLLARAGLRPIILERGGSVEERQAAVNTFWQTRKLNPSCNVQFGEGGAGTFSDGKLNTGTKDERIFFVLQTLCEHGAPEDILFDAKPHVGTDKLPQTVRAIREEIKSLGGEVRFNTQMTDLLVKNNAVCGVVAETNGVNETIETAHVILAIGHSARDTFKMLFEKAVYLWSRSRFPSARASSTAQRR